jgi:hypothetical protein
MTKRKNLERKQNLSVHSPVKRYLAVRHRTARQTQRHSTRSTIRYNGFIDHPRNFESLFLKPTRQNGQCRKVLIRMLEKPAVEDQNIIECLKKEYGLRITQLDFLPLGGNLFTAVYRAVADDGMHYFCKLRCSDFDEISVELPKYLSEQGIAPTIPPLTTQTDQLWAALDSFYVIFTLSLRARAGSRLN